MRESLEYTIWNAVTPQAVTSSTDATPIVVTKNSHGYSNGDLIIINGHATNIAANGIYKVANKAANTFELTDRYSGSNVAGSGAGAGANGVVALAPKIILAQDFRHAVLSVHTTGSANFTVKVAGSLGIPRASASLKDGDTPNFGATQSPTNPYTYLNLVDLLDGTSVAGGTGVTSAGTDINKNYEININGMKYITIVPTAWSAGAITVKINLFNP